MSDPAPPSALVDGRVLAGQKAMLQALLWTIVGASLSGILMLIAMAVSVQKEREAGRMMIDAQKGVGYAAMVTNALAASQGRHFRGL